MTRASDHIEGWAARWPNFAPDEVACKGCTSESPCRRDRLDLDPVALDKLQHLRNEWGAPLRINSAYRCPYHNANVGGAARSHHRVGDAFDISVAGMSDEDKGKLYRLAVGVGFSGFGFYGTFLHVDTGPSRKWATNGGKKTWNFLVTF